MDRGMRDRREAETADGETAMKESPVTIYGKYYGYETMCTHTVHPDTRRSSKTTDVYCRLSTSIGISPIT